MESSRIGDKSDGFDLRYDGTGGSDEKFRQVGLARVLSKLGYCSRSKAFELIRAGRVQVNGALPQSELPVNLEKIGFRLTGSDSG